jgi:NAD(P)-dependent dehydrogenase (short-subunit alcohol dehydrogenase family)
MYLDGKVALVTGSGQGIGYEIAEILAENGAHVIMNDVDKQLVSSAADSLRAKDYTVSIAPGDISKTSDVSEIVDVGLRVTGKIDILVNNAGIAIFKEFLDHTEDEWDKIFAVNVRSIFLLCKAIVPTMRAIGSGTIVNVSSIAAFHYTNPHVAYAASKAAIVALTRDLAYEFAPSNIRINAVAPGAIMTPLTATQLSQEVKDAISQAIPTGRWGTPRDIASTVLFLVSDSASYITGQTILVTGGVEIGVLSK